MLPDPILIEEGGEGEEGGEIPAAEGEEGGEDVVFEETEEGEGEIVA